MPFELEAFIQDCHLALTSDEPQRNMRETVARVVSQRKKIVDAFGEPAKGQVTSLLQSHKLTILNVVWAPEMNFLPHNHTMWAVIGVYGGRENNIFWKRVSAMGSTIEAAGAKSLGEGEVTILGPDVIHSVTNPIPRLTGAIHVYAGDFANAHRSEWDPEGLAERACDATRLARQLDEQNKRWFATS